MAKIDLKMGPRSAQDRLKTIFKTDFSALEHRLDFVAFWGRFWCHFASPKASLWAPFWRSKSIKKSIRNRTAQKVAPRSPQDRPRPPQEAPRTPQEHPRCPPGPPRPTQDRPRTDQDHLKTTNQASEHPSLRSPEECRDDFRASKPQNIQAAKSLQQGAGGRGASLQIRPLPLRRAVWNRAGLVQFFSQVEK